LSDLVQLHVLSIGALVGLVQLHVLSIGASVGLVQLHVLSIGASVGLAQLHALSIGASVGLVRRRRGMALRRTSQAAQPSAAGARSDLVPSARMVG
jgi:hypothetical protein